tara:strand:- start:4190 stop:4564 length:375 start_codon:yes stop_codon:yes gene_type:complete
MLSLRGTNIEYLNICVFAFDFFFCWFWILRFFFVLFISIADQILGYTLLGDYDNNKEIENNDDDFWKNIDNIVSNKTNNKISTLKPIPDEKYKNKQFYLNELDENSNLVLSSCDDNSEIESDFN